MCLNSLKVPVLLLVFLLMVHSKSLTMRESKNETIISSNKLTSSHPILTNETSTVPSHVKTNSTTIDNSGLSDRIVLSTCVFLSCVGR